MLPRVMNLRLLTDTRVAEAPLGYADADPLFDPRRAERARQFAIAFIGAAAARKRIA